MGIMKKLYYLKHSGLSNPDKLIERVQSKPRTITEIKDIEEEEHEADSSCNRR